MTKRTSLRKGLMEKTTQGFALAAVVLVGLVMLSASSVRAGDKAAQPADGAANGKRLPDTPYRWKNVAIHGGGFVSGIIAHPTEKGLLYARTDVGGAYRWQPKAARWIPLTDGFGRSDWNLYGVESIAPDPSDPNRVYLAVGTYTNDWAGNGAVLRSADRGTTWQRTNLPFKLGGNEDGRSNGERLAVDPNDNHVLFMGTRVAGLWKSPDRGATWSRVDSFPAIATTSVAQYGTGEWVRQMGIVFVQFVPGSEKKGQPTSTLYAGVSTWETSVFRSTDGGKMWSPVPGQPNGLRPNHAVLTSNALYLSYGDSPGPNGMTDGAVWKLDTKAGAWTNVTPLKPSDGDRFGYGGITVDARHPEIVMVSTMDRWAKKDEVFRSTDGGKTWKPLLHLNGSQRERAVFDSSPAPYAASLNPHWMGDIEIDPSDPDHVLFVTGYGIWATHYATVADHGGTPKWIFENTGLEETVPLSLASPPSGDAHLLSAIGDFDGFRHIDLDVSPRTGRHQPSIGSTSQITFAAQKPEVVVRVGGRRALLSQDGGVTWNEFAAKLPGVARGGSIALAADASVLVWSPDGNRETPSVSRDRGVT